MDTGAPADELLRGRWRVGELLGRGAAADVHVATDAETGREAAVKVIRAADGDAARRFDREVAALEGIDHPGIVSVLDHGTCPDGRPFVVLERAEGGSLHDLLAGGPLGPERAAATGAELADALDHAHQRGVVHRDVKPANVLLDGTGRTKLADFGIARLVDGGTLTATGWAIGTPAYLAPEQVRGERVGPPADVYALGLVILEAATGERAYPGDGFASALARLERPVAIPSTVPPGLAATIAAMTAADPAARPTAAEAASRLGAAHEGGATAALRVAGLATAAMPAGTVARVSTGRHRLDLALAGLAAGLLAVLLLQGFNADGGGSPEPLAELESTTTATTAPTTTTAPPDDDEDEDEGDGEGPDRPGDGNGNGGGGGNGNGRGNGNGDD